MYLNSEILVHINQEHEKNDSHLFGSGKKWFLAILSLTNTVAAIWREIKVDPSYLETKKKQFTTVRSKEKDYDMYLKTEKLVHSNQQHEKNVSHLFGSGKKMVPSYFEPEKHCCCYLEIKVDSCYLETKKSSLQLLGARKMIMTFI